MQLTMKSEVILFCVLSFCSKIVDSFPHSEEHVRQRVNPNAPNEQYIDTDFTQPRNINIQQSHQRIYNYDSNGYNRGPAPSPSGEDLLVSKSSPTDGRRFDSYPPRVESYKSRTSQVGFDNQQYRNQNWHSQNQYINSVPSVVLIPDEERPLMTTVQEPYRGPVQYLQPKYVPSSNRRFNQPGMSYLTREQLQYPLISDSKYVANSAPHFEPNGQVPYENFNEDQVATSVIKARPIGAQRYAQNCVPQSGTIYNEAPAIIATDTLTEKSEDIGFAENYRSSSDSSNTAPVTNYNDDSFVVTDNYSSDSGASKGPVPYERYIEDQAAASEVKTRPTGGRRNVQSFAPGFGIHYNEAPVVIGTDTLKDETEKIKYIENYKSGSDLSKIAPITNYNDGYPVTTQPDNYSSNSVASNGPVPYESYIEGQAAAFEEKTRSTGGRRYVQSFPPQFGINYNEAPVVVAPADTPKYQTENIKYEENYKSGSELSNTAPIANHDDSFPLISEADYNSDYISSTLAQVNTKKDASVDISKILSEKPLVRRYSENYKPDSEWRNIARDGSSNVAPVVTETAEVKSGNYEANYEYDYGSKKAVPLNTYSGAPSSPFVTVLVNSGSNKHEESNVSHHGSSSPTLLNPNPKQNVHHKKTSGITEFNLKSFVESPKIQKIIAGSNKRYLLIHSNGTVETLDKIDLDSHQNSKLRVVHTKHNNIDDSDSDGILTEQLPENFPNGIAKTPVPVDEYPSPTNNRPADDKKATPLHLDQANPADNSNLSPQLKDRLANHNNLKTLPERENQPVDNNNSKLLPSYVIPPADDNNSMPLTLNVDLSDQKDNVKPLPQDVNQPRDDVDSKPLTPHINQASVDGTSYPLPQDGNQPAVDENSKVLTPNTNQLADDDNSKLLTSKKDQPADYNYLKLDQPKDENNFSPLFPNARQPEHGQKPKHSYVKLPANDNISKPLPKNENQPHDDKPLHIYGRQPAYSKHSQVNQSEDKKNSNQSSPSETEQENYEKFKPLPSYEHQSGDATDSTSLPSHEKELSQHYGLKSRHSHDLPADDNNSSSSSTPHLNYPENQPSGDHKSIPSSLGESPTGDDNTSKPLPSCENQLGHNDFKPLRTNKRQPAYHNKTKHSHVNQLEDDNYSEPSSAEEDQTGNDTNFKPSNENQSEDGEGDTVQDSEPLQPNKIQPAQHNKSKHSHVNKLEDDNYSKPSSADEDQIGNDANFKPSNKSQSGDGIDSEPLRPSNKQQAHHNKSKHSQVNKPADDYNREPLLSDEEQTVDENISKPLPETQSSANNRKSKPSQGDQGGEDSYSNPSSPDENQPEEDKKSKPLIPNENQPADDLKTIPTSAVVSKNYDQSTVSLTVPNYTTSSKPQVIKIHTRKHIQSKSTTDAPVVSTTSCPDDTSEDQVITLSPVEQITDNVSDVPPVATTTTTTTRPVRTPGKSEIINDTNIKHIQDDIAHAYSTTTVSPSTSTPPTDNKSDYKTIGTKENENTLTKNKTVVDQVNNRDKDIQTGTDVPAKSDDYSSVTASPSVQSDVNTGDASGDNSLEFEKSETDVTITVSSSTSNEDKMITINIEVSESTDADDADSSSNDKSLVVRINTNDGRDDHSKTPKPVDCKQDHKSEDGRGKNVEIDMSNLNGEPTMWIRTTNQDFIDKLTAKKGTEFDVIYYFAIRNEPVIEREKATTIYCNGTVVIETTDITIHMHTNMIQHQQ